MRGHEIPFRYVIAAALLLPGLMLAGCQKLQETGQTGQTGTTAVSSESASVSSGSTTTVTEVTSTLSSSSSSTTVRSTTTTAKAPAPTVAKKAPTITKLNPSWAALDAQGAEVVVTGTGFTGVVAVTFGGIPAMDFRFDSDTQITAHAPVHSESTVNVQVTTSAGKSADTLADDFMFVDTSSNAPAIIPGVIMGNTPTITNLIPKSGPRAGNFYILIVGTGFTGVTDVTIAGGSVTYHVLSDTEIYALAPPWPGGVVDVQVTAGGVKTAPGPEASLTYF